MVTYYIISFGSLNFTALNWVLTHNLCADHSQGLALSGVDLSRHDRTTRLVLGQIELTKTTPRSRPKVSDVVSNLHERTGKGVKSTTSLHDSIMSSQGLKLVRGSLEIDAGELRDLVGDSNIKAGFGIQSRTNSGTTLGKKLQAGEGSLDTLNTVGKLGGIAGELLTESQRGGVLQVCSANLDDVAESLHFLFERSMQASQAREELLGDLDGGSNVHDTGESVVGGGAHVDMVVGVDRLLGSHLTTEHLNGTVRDNLISIHVRLGTGTGLPDNQREMIQKLARDDLIGSLLNSLSELGIQSVGHVDGGRGTLEDTERFDDWRGHPVERLVDLEVGERPCSEYQLADYSLPLPLPSGTDPTAYLWVCAPQYLSEDTSISPKASRSILVPLVCSK